VNIPPPPRYRDIKIAGSYDDNVQPAPVRDVQALSAAELKRARKAAKRRESMKRQDAATPLRRLRSAEELG
jgi:hypothetical protein